RRDEGPRSMTLYEQPFRDKALHRLADGDTRDIGEFGDVPLGGQRVAGFQHAAFYGLRYIVAERQIKRPVRHGGAPLPGEDRLPQIIHGDEPSLHGSVTAP